MGIFSLTKEIAIDLGTANTIIIHNDKIVVDEPSIVAIEVSTKQDDHRGQGSSDDAGDASPKASAPYARCAKAS